MTPRYYSSAEQAERERQRRIREWERTQRAQARQEAANAREEKRQFLEARMDDVEEMNRELEQTVESLKSLLVKALNSRSAIDFEKLKLKPQIPELRLGALEYMTPPPDWSRFAAKKPNPLIGWIPQQQRAYTQRMAIAKHTFEYATAQHAKAEEERQASIAKLRDEREKNIVAANSAAAKANSVIDEWREAFDRADRDAVEEYCRRVLSNSAYPEEFPKETRVAFVKESNQLVVEYDFPVMDEAIPKQKSFTYIKASNKVNTTSRPEKDRRNLYASVIAQCTLRTLHELFGADTQGLIETIVLNGYVDTIHPGTGQSIRPCLVTVRSTREQFTAINLRMAEPTAALQTLNASFSKSPAELAPVRPLLEFNMVDSRFIEESDVLSILDQRPNLMDLSPGEFESLITNLFQKMGLETKLTQASRDGGVDCVAFDPRPIFGGKVVIQAKRYKNTVGVSAVRDLFGTMQNEGASKGILVTTSGYGKASFEFASGKPLELLDGGHLLYLLKEHTGNEARIVMPDDWKDPVMDSGS